MYRIEPDGTHDVFFDPDERYIWALAFDSAGRLHVATGDAARVYRVTSSGEGEVLFSSEETHIVSLIVDANDRLFAGTDPNGLVLSVDPNGTTSVLFDTPFQEVRALVSDTRGNVFAATVNGGTRAAPPEAPTPAGFPTPDPLAAAAGGVAVTVTAFADANVIPPGPAPSASSQAGGLYRIDSEGAADLLHVDGRALSRAPADPGVGADDREADHAASSNSPRSLDTLRSSEKHRSTWSRPPAPRRAASSESPRSLSRASATALGS